MSGAIRNYCVARGTVNANEVIAPFQVPADSALILKSIKIQCLAGPPGSCVVYVRDATGVHQVVVADIMITDVMIASWDSWMVLNATDFILLQSLTIQFSYWISGAVLPYGAAPAIRLQEPQEVPNPPTAPPRPGHFPDEIRLVP